MSTTDAFAAIAAELYGLVPGEFTGPATTTPSSCATRATGSCPTGSSRCGSRPPRRGWSTCWSGTKPTRSPSCSTSGQALRQAQDDLDGDALRELNRQRRRLIAAVAGKGKALARDLGQKVSESVVRQVEDTLHAAMIDTDAAAAVRSGAARRPAVAAGGGVAEGGDRGRRAHRAGVVRAAAVGGGRRLVGRQERRKRPARAGLRAVPGPDAEERARREAEERARGARRRQRRSTSAEEDVAEARAGAGRAGEGGPGPAGAVPAGQRRDRRAEAEDRRARGPARAARRGVRHGARGARRGGGAGRGGRVRAGGGAAALDALGD